MSAGQFGYAVTLDSADPDYATPNMGPRLLDGITFLPGASTGLSIWNTNSGTYGVVTMNVGPMGLMSALTAPALRAFAKEMVDIADRIEAVAFEASQAAIAKAKAVRS